MTRDCGGKSHRRPHAGQVATCGEAKQDDGHDRQVTQVSEAARLFAHRPALLFGEVGYATRNPVVLVDPAGGDLVLV